MKKRWLRWLRLAILFGLLWATAPAASQADGGEQFIQLGLAYIQEQAPGSAVTLINSHTFAHSETGVSYTLVKADLDGVDGRLVTVRHSDGFVQPGNSLAERDQRAYINRLPPPYRKMSQALRGAIQEQYGSLPADAAEAAALGGEPLPVVFIVTPQADLPALAARLKTLAAEVAVYDGVEVYQRALAQGKISADVPRKPIRLAAAALELPSVLELSGDPGVAAIWLNRKGELFLDQSVPAINADDVQNAGYSGWNTRVGVIDTGLDQEHPSVGSIGGCEDFTNDTIDPPCDDNNGHGTHVAGIIFSHNYTYGGVAPLAELYIAKVLSGGSQSGYMSTDISGIDWALNQGVNVIQMSLGFPDVVPNDGSSQISRYVDSVVYAGGRFVNAGGNKQSGINPNGVILAPSDAFNTICVGRTDVDFNAVHPDSVHAPTTDGRAKIDVVAPGTEIMSLAHNWEGTNSDFVEMSGTSMAAPHVSGLAALLYDYGTTNLLNRSPMLLKALLINTADELTGWTKTVSQPLDYNQGGGQVDALAAYNAYKTTNKWLVDQVNCVGYACRQYYLFRITNAPTELRVTLVWQRHEVDYTDPAPVTLNDLDLDLWSEKIVIGYTSSVSAVDNVEHIRYDIEQNGYYWLRVVPYSLDTDGLEDYALVANVALTDHGSAPIVPFAKSSPISGSDDHPNQVALSWQSTIGAASYEYCVDTTNNNTCNTAWQSAGSNTSAVSVGLSPGLTYYWQVRGVNSFGKREANDGAWWSFSVDGTPPSPPTSANPNCTATSNTWQDTCANANFTWSGASDSGSGIAGYYYYWGGNPSGTSINHTSAAAYNPPAVGNPSVTYLRVQTFDNAGNTSAWTTLFILKYDDQSPTNPTGVNPGCTATSDVWQTTCQNPNFTWSGAGDGSGSGIAGYYYYWGTNSTGTSTNWTAGAAYDPPSVANPSVSYLRVQTKDNAGNTSAWTTLFIFKYDTTTPAAPSGLAAEVISPTQVNLSWTDNSLSETSFRVERSPNGSTGWAEIGSTGAGVTSYSDSSLGCATPYYYRVRAHRSGDNQYSAYSEVANITTQTCGLLNAPTNLTATAWTTSLIRLKWTDTSSNETEFRIERSRDGYSGWSEVGVNPANDRIYDDTGLTCGTTYYYRVRAYRSNDVTYSAYSNIASTATLNCVFYAPSDLSAIAVSDSILHLVWVDNTTEESLFSIEYQPEGSSTWSVLALVDPDETTYDHSGLSCDVQFSYRVRALRSMDNLYSDYSNVATGITLGCAQPKSPTNLTGFPTPYDETSINLSWTDNSHDENDFHIQRWDSSAAAWIEFAWVVDNTTSAGLYVTCGTLYRLRVLAHRHADDQYSAPSNEVEVESLSCQWNDDFYGYQLSPLPFSRSQNVTPATLADDDPFFPPSCYTSLFEGRGTHTVWYYYRSHSDGALSLHTEGSAYDNYLAVWTGERGSLTNVGCAHNPDSGNTLLVELAPDITYYIEAVGRTINDYGQLQLYANIIGASTPVLSRLSPPWKAAGMPGFNLFIYGTNLVDGLSSVLYNGIARPATYNNGTLILPLTVDDLLKTGSFPVSVDNTLAGGGISNALNFHVFEPTSFDIQTNWAKAIPALDGVISAGEWADAMTYDITAPDYAAAALTGQYEDVFPLPALPSGWLAVSQPLSAVTLYLKSDATHLYLAIDNPFDTTPYSGDEVYLYFDDNPLPSDGLWSSTTCGNPDGEGYFRFRTTEIRFTEYKATHASCADLINPPGVSSAFGFTGGHRQVEISLDLTASALRLPVGGEVAIFLRLWDSSTSTYQGVWPNHGDPYNPASFRTLTLDLARLYLPLVRR